MAQTTGPTLLQATRLSVEIYGEAATEAALATVHRLSADEIRSLMRQLKASQN